MINVGSKVLKRLDCVGVVEDVMYRILLNERMGMMMEKLCL